MNYINNINLSQVGRNLWNRLGPSGVVVSCALATLAALTVHSCFFQNRSLRLAPELTCQTPAELSSQELQCRLDLEFPFIRDWVNRALDTDEYENRIIAARKILQCIESRSPFLDLSNLGLTSLEGLLFQDFIELDLQNNQISSIANISFSNVENLYLNGNPFTDLSSTQLSEIGCISINPSQIPDILSTDLRGVEMVNLYNDAPLLESRFPNNVVGLPEIVLEDTRNCPNLTEHSNYSDLITFLNRLPEIPDYQNKNTQAQVIQTMNEILHSAEKNEEFRKTLFNEISQGTTNCADRPTYCFSRLVDHLTLYKAENKGPAAVLNALYNLKRVEAIENYANELSNGEELEAALWLRLNILPDPNGVQSMNQTRYVLRGLRLRKAHLAEANRRVAAVTDSEEKRVAILANSPYFQKKCELKPEYAKITEEAAEKLAKLYETELTEAEKLEKTKLIELERKKLFTDFVFAEAIRFFRECSQEIASSI